MEQSFVLQLNTLFLPRHKTGYLIWSHSYTGFRHSCKHICYSLSLVIDLSIFFDLSFSPSIYLSIHLISLSIYSSYSSIYLCGRELLTVIQQGRMSLISLMLSLMTVRACSASSLIMASPSTSLRNRGGKPKLTSFNFYSPLDVKHLYNRPLPFLRTPLPEFQKLKAFRGGDL